MPYAMGAEYAIATADRRQEPRFAVMIDAAFTLKDKRCACTILSLSASGLLLRLHENSHFRLSQDDIGEIGEVTIEPGRTRRGTIVRFLSWADVRVVAVLLL